jgi:hypothetical protein
MRPIYIPFVFVVLLIGCTSPGSLKPGLSEETTIRSLGQPNATYVLPDGTRRLEYSGSFSQQAWMIDFQNGSLKRSEQVMTVEKFSQLKPGQDNKTSVQNLFGTPFEIVQLARLQREVWSYRLKLNGVFPALMHVQFDRTGIVREIFSGPDLEWEREIKD